MENQKSAFERIAIGFCILGLGVILGHGWSYYQTKSVHILLQTAQKELVNNQLDIIMLQDRISELEKQTKNLKLNSANEIQLLTTGYCNSHICINDPRWQDGITATGTVAKRGVCAADWDILPVGTELYVEGYGWCRIEDRGGKIKGYHIDLFFDTYEEAKAWGKKIIKVVVKKEEKK